MKIILASFILLISHSIALSCTCVNTQVPVKQHNKWLKDVSAIFDGEVVSLGDKKTIVRKYNGGVTIEDIVQPVTFHVYRVWKGIEQEEITVETDVGSSCALKPTVGSRFTVYAYTAGKPSGELSMNYCSVGHFDDAKMMVEYGEGKFIQATPNEVSELDEPEPTFISLIWNKIISFFS